MKVEKRGYSRSPWRLVTSDGREVYAPQAFAHPDLGATAISAPVCGETKTECTAQALALLEALLTPRAAPGPSRFFGTCTNCGSAEDVAAGATRCPGCGSAYAPGDVTAF